MNTEEIDIKKEKMKIAIVIHHDLDGITSGAEAVRAFGENVENVVIYEHDPNERFSEIYADIVIIVDIAFTEKTYGSLTNIHANKIIWIDHHRPFVDISLKFPENVKVVLDPSSPSAVLLVKKYFGLDDDIAQKLSDLGTKADTWKLEPLVQEWMDIDSAFSYYKMNKTPLVFALARGQFEIQGELKEILETYRNEKEKAKQELISNTVVRNIHGHSVAIGFAPSILSGSESADIVLKATNSEVQIVVKPEGWLSFRRRKDSQVNLIELAKKFNGGGHEYASGGELGNTVTQENFTEIAEEIFSKISEVL